jgi:hypothetical protein
MRRPAESGALCPGFDLGNRPWEGQDAAAGPGFPCGLSLRYRAEDLGELMPDGSRQGSVFSGPRGTCQGAPPTQVFPHGAVLLGFKNSPPREVIGLSAWGRCHRVSFR